MYNIEVDCCIPNTEVFNLLLKNLIGTLIIFQTSLMQKSKLIVIIIIIGIVLYFYIELLTYSFIRYL